jgi:D-aminoacyl-tRNA deacylase
MRAVVQRVTWARVKVAQEIVGEIEQGLLVLLGVGTGDTAQDVAYLAPKVVHLRIFADENQNMNRSLLEVGGALLVVSQFTLHGDCRKGRRPSFIDALEPVEAERLCELFCQTCAALGPPVQTGRFRAMMDVELCNSGPVTLLLDSRKAF